jgi:haloacetate dehalogenase
MVGGHDRGGRVAYRLALDHPEAVRALIPIDIYPTAEVWRRMTAERAISGYHWQFWRSLIHCPSADRQGPGVLPGAHAEELGRSARPLPFSAEALAHYRALLKRPRACMPSARTIAPAPASTASWTRRTSPRAEIACPTFVLWGAITCRGRQPLEVWKTWCTNVAGAVVKSGTSWPRENLAGHARRGPVPFLKATGSG